LAASWPDGYFARFFAVQQEHIASPQHGDIGVIARDCDFFPRPANNGSDSTQRACTIGIRGMQEALTMNVADQSLQFQELLERHRGIVFKVANTYCRDPHDRADLAQEIAAQAWRSFASYDRDRRFSTWLYRVALNVAISFRRHSGRHEQHTVAFDEQLHDTPAEGADVESDERVRALYRCIDALDPLNRALLILYLDERSQREIGEILGISETNVATKIGRLKERLRNDMSEA
jgi:RNA polymerase sigma-70 factor (ECF subfamily)